MTHQRRTREAVRDEVERTMREAGGHVATAATLAGCTVPTYYQRAARCGLSLVDLRREMPGDAVLTESGVTLSLADYAVLQAQAAMGREAYRLQSALDTSERIIATLTRQVESFGARQEAA